MMDNYKNVLHILLWILIENVVQTSARYCNSYYYYSYYCRNTSIYWSIGSIVGAVIGSLIGLAILIVIVVVLCGACKHSGNRGTVIQPVNTTTNTVIHTVPMNQPPPPQYNQYPPPGGGAMYPPPQNMAYPPPPPMGGTGPGPANYNQPPPYPGVVDPAPGGIPPTK